MTDREIAEIWRLIERESEETRRQVFELLRRQFPIHPLEAEWKASAELVLDAISRSSDLTKRGVRGVIAEAAFEQSVVQPLLAQGWSQETPEGDHPFDFQLADSAGPVKVQVKMQRLENRLPKLWSSGSRFFVVETQKTRSGTDSAGKSTRPYRFGEFDILAVCMHPSCGDWTKFRYTVARWLLSRPEDRRKLIRVLQPVPDAPNADWFDDFHQALESFRKGKRKSIYEPPKRPSSGAGKRKSKSRS